MKVVSVRVKPEPRDLWVGLYIGKKGWEGWRLVQDFYFTVIPMLPIVVTVEHKSSI